MCGPIQSSHQSSEGGIIWPFIAEETEAPRGKVTGQCPTAHREQSWGFCECGLNLQPLHSWLYHVTWYLPWYLSLSSRQIVGLSKGWEYDLFICVLFLPHLLVLRGEGRKFCLRGTGPEATKETPVPDWAPVLFCHLECVQQGVGC